jgi:hypothetical protein
MLGMSAMASVVPKLVLAEAKSEKATISSIGNFGLGVWSVDVMRITANGRVILNTVSPSANLDILKKK